MHPPNIVIVVVTLDVSRFEKSTEVKAVHCMNISFIAVVLEVSKPEKSISVMFGILANSAVHADGAITLFPPSRTKATLVMFSA